MPNPLPALRQPYNNHMLTPVQTQTPPPVGAGIVGGASPGSTGQLMDHPQV